MNNIRQLALGALLGALTAMPLHAEDAVSTSVGDLYRDKAALDGKQVSLQGQVVKVNNGIMKRNFVHIQDGSGDAADGSNDLIVTTKADTAVGETVVLTGNIVLDKDFGAGYSYPVLLEDASVTTE